MWYLCLAELRLDHTLHVVCEGLRGVNFAVGGGDCGSTMAPRCYKGTICATADGKRTRKYNKSNYATTLSESLCRHSQANIIKALGE